MYLRNKFKATTCAICTSNNTFARSSDSELSQVREVIPFTELTAYNASLAKCFTGNTAPPNNPLELSATCRLNAT